LAVPSPTAPLRGRQETSGRNPFAKAFQTTRIRVAQKFMRQQIHGKGGNRQIAQHLFDALVPDFECTPLADAIPLAINHHIAPDQPVVACA